VTSIVQVFQVPVRHALVPESVDRAHLTNAISLNSLAFNVSRSVGPATAGGLIAVVGAGGSYLAQAMIFALSTLWTVQLRLPNQPPGSEDRLQGRQPTIWRSTLAGWRYVLDHATIRTGLIVSAVVSFFGMSSSTLLPVFAKDVLQGGSTAQGLLLGAAGIGAVASAMFVAVIGDQLPKGSLMIGGVVAYGLSTLAFSASHWLGVSILLMLVTGACNVACTTVIQTVLQAHAAPPMRGRVMAVYQQHHILIAGGGLLAGAVATVFGAPLTVGMLGTACVLGALAMYFAVPLVRTLR
jgi:MFS family permease